MNDRTDLDALTMRVIDLEQWRNRVDRRQPDPARPRDRQCPPWCILPPDHDFDNAVNRDYDGTVMRSHIGFRWTLPWTPGALDVGVEVIQTVAAHPDGTIDADEAPSVIVSGCAPSTFAGVQARALAAAITQAADVLDRIEAGQ